MGVASGIVNGVDAAPYQEPRQNLTGDPYYTDGLRAVIELSSEAVKPGLVYAKDWEIPPYKSITNSPGPGKGSEEMELFRMPISNERSP